MFEGTVLHQDTFALKRPATRMDSEGAYTPFQLSTWEFAEETSGLDARNMFLHEMAHCIYMFERGTPERLLQKNYGFTFGYFTQATFDLEAWVLALQCYLCREVCGYDSLTDDTVRRVRNQFSVKVDVPLDVFRAQLADLTRYHESRGVEHYAAQWQAVCAYVRTHRGEPEPDLVFALLGMRF